MVIDPDAGLSSCVTPTMRNSATHETMNTVTQFPFTRKINKIISFNGDKRHVGPTRPCAINRLQSTAWEFDSFRETRTEI